MMTLIGTKKEEQPLDKELLRMLACYGKIRKGFVVGEFSA
jgi:hypothetical protein